MRFVLILAIALLATGCAKHPIGAWQPVPPTTAAEIIPPPPDAAVPRMAFPLYAQESDGRDAEPITMIVAADETQLVDAFTKAGWVAAEAVTPESIEKLRIAQAWADSYPNAPVSPLYYFGRPQDAAFQRPGATIASRLRVRIWRSDEQDAQGRWLWALNVAQEEGFRSVPSVGMPIHHMLPDVDKATESLIQDFVKAGVPQRDYLLKGIGSNHGFRTAAGDPYHTAGWVQVLEF